MPRYRLCSAIIALGFVVTIGCAPKPIAMDQAMKSSLQNVQDIKILYHKPSDFEVPPNSLLMMGGAVGGVLAAVEAQSRSEQMTKAYGLVDPTMQVKREFVHTLRTIFSNARFSEEIKPHQDDDLSKLAEEFRQGLVLDLKTTRWGMLSVPLQGYQYVLYQNRTRIIQLPEQKVLWQGVCDLQEKDAVKMPGIAEFEANNGALLKDNFSKMTAACSDLLAKQLTGAEAAK